MSLNGGALPRSRGIFLAATLFSNYLLSPAFNTDVLQMMLDNLRLYLSGYHSSLSTAISMGFLSGQLMYRIMECFVVAMMLDSRFHLLQDAAMFHVMFHYVRHYHFTRCWMTRLLGALGNFILPRFLNRMIRSSETSAAKTTPYPIVDSSNSVMNECKESLAFYYNIYSTSVPYAVFVSGIVCNVTQVLFDQLVWMQMFYQSRKKKTSRWRLLKPYLCKMVESVTQMTLVCASRIAGVWAIKLVSCSPTDGALFWSERIALLAASPFIHHTAMSTYMRLWNRLEVLYPATLEDEQEDICEREKAEEACGGASCGSNRFSALGVQEEDLYNVLGVSPNATGEEIKRAYRAAALEYHPDRVSRDQGTLPNVQERMVAINRAYETLSSESKRRQYDRVHIANNMSSTFGKFNNLSKPAALGVGVVSVVGLSTMVSFFLYVQYLSAFHHLTGPGDIPLRFLVKTLWVEGS